MKYFIIILFMFCHVAWGQERLTLQEAIARTLAHNFDIRIASLAEQQAARNNTYGNAGFSPYVFLNASATKTWSNTHSELTNGTTQRNPNAQSVNYNPNISVSWTIFDGGKMFLMKTQLDELEHMSELQLRVQMQTMVSRTIQMYAQVVWKQKQLRAIDTAIVLAKLRMDISRLKYETGASAKVDYLQARVDYNARQADSLTFTADLVSVTDSLGVLMGADDDRRYITDDSLELNTNLEPVDKEKLAAANLNLGLFRYNARVSHLNEDIAKTYFLPTLSFNGGYSFSRSTSATGFTSYNQSYGPSGTLTLSLPVFEGGNLRRQAKVASLQAMRDDLLYDKQNTVLGRQYRTAWRNYQVAVAAYKLEHENIQYARENLFIQQARFRVGIATTLESRQAENDYITALVRLYTAAYNLKVNETVVLELENKLVRSEP
jgi:outer membrane protein